jgi:hypothetical protein
MIVQSQNNEFTTLGLPLHDCPITKQRIYYILQKHFCENALATLISNFLLLQFKIPTFSIVRRTAK